MRFCFLFLASDFLCSARFSSFLPETLHFTRSPWLWTDSSAVHFIVSSPTQHRTKRTLTCSVCTGTSWRTSSFDSSYTSSGQRYPSPSCKDTEQCLSINFPTVSVSRFSQTFFSINGFVHTPRNWVLKISQQHFSNGSVHIPRNWVLKCTRQSWCRYPLRASIVPEAFPTKQMKQWAELLWAPRS